MTDPISPLEAWNTYYVIVGSAAAALTGLMFVVVTLIPSARVPSSGDSIDAFGTPTIVHMSTALFISAALCAPWPTLTAAGVAVGSAGVFGVVYVLIVIRRAKRQRAYQPVLEDVIWHMVLPLMAYLSVLGSWFGLHSNLDVALFGFAGGTILLLFVGIHNAWDTVTFIAVDRMGPARSMEATPTPPAPPAVPANDRAS